MKKNLLNNHFIDINGNLFLLPVPKEKWIDPILSKSGDGQVIIKKMF